jgi:hypothetical protein
VLREGRSRAATVAKQKYDAELGDLAERNFLFKVKFALAIVSILYCFSFLSAIILGVYRAIYTEYGAPPSKSVSSRIRPKRRSNRRGGIR